MAAGASKDELQRQAIEFANEMTETVRAVVPDAAAFRASAASSRTKQTRLFIRQEPQEGITLSVAGVPMLRLEVSFRCVFDHRERYLAVEDSKIEVGAVATSGEPPLRYEYLRSPTSGVPGAHLQVHAHRDAFTYVMTRCGDASRRGRRRQDSSDAGRRVPQLSDLHMPLGGPRFRPCLEDVLQMLIDEMGVEAPSTARAALAEGRARWRRKQLGACVRDSPETAAKVLAELGYLVDPPGGVHVAERTDTLTVL